MTILEARQKAKLTRRAASELLGIPYRTFENWEAGNNICPPWAEKLIIAELTKLYIIQSGGDDATVLQQAEEIIKKNI